MPQGIATHQHQLPIPLFLTGTCLLHNPVFQAPSRRYALSSPAPRAYSLRSLVARRSAAPLTPLLFAFCLDATRWGPTRKRSAGPSIQNSARTQTAGSTLLPFSLVQVTGRKQTISAYVDDVRRLKLSERLAGRGKTRIRHCLRLERIFSLLHGTISTNSATRNRSMLMLHDAIYLVTYCGSTECPHHWNSWYREST